jgi:hypothetical protein
MKTVKKYSKKSKTRRIRGGNSKCKYNKDEQTYNISIQESLKTKNLDNLLNRLYKKSNRLDGKIKPLCRTSKILSEFPNAEDVYSTKGVYDERRDWSSSSSKSKRK